MRACGRGVYVYVCMYVLIMYTYYLYLSIQPGREWREKAWLMAEVQKLTSYVR